MVSAKVQRSYFRLAVPEFYSVVFTSTKSFQGFGGALGTLAFISLLTTICFFILFEKYYNKREF
jgi:hypothetical protein